MNRCSKPILVAAILAFASITSAQETPVPAAETPAPVAEPAPVATPPVAEPAPIVVDSVQANAPAEPVAEAPVTEPVAPAAEPVATTEPAPVIADTAQAAPAVQASAPTAEPKKEQPRKKRRTARPVKNDFAIVDVPANFEIQMKKDLPFDSELGGQNGRWGDNNLDQWWGRANLMVLTESENFVGKVHLRMYPKEFKSVDGNGKSDLFEIYEAWAWHRGDYANLKIGRWDNTTRFGSRSFGGYVDAQKDTEFFCLNATGDREVNCKDAGAQRTNVAKVRNRRAVGFMSTYNPENAVQFGINTFSENVSLDVALISSDANLNRGDLRAYFQFRDLAGVENMTFGVGYRSNIFDKIYGDEDVTHTVDVGARLPLVKDAGVLKDLSIFAEAAFIGFDDQTGTFEKITNKTGDEIGIAEFIPSDNGKTSCGDDCDFSFPILAGIDISLYKLFDKVVIEAEWEQNRKNTTPEITGDRGTERNARDVQGSIFVQKKINDRFTISGGVQNEYNTKDVTFAARLQGRIN